VSNPIRYDSLLVRHLTAELHDRLAGKPVHGLLLDPQTRTARLDLSGATLIWELHPTRGRATLTEPPATAAQRSGPGRELMPGEVRLPRQPRIRRVAAPPDERLVFFDLSGAGARAGRTRRLVIELVTNQWNAFALDGDERILAALVARDAGGRTLRRGRRYTPPPPTDREGAASPLDEARWLTLLAGVLGAGEGDACDEPGAPLAGRPPGGERVAAGVCFKQIARPPPGRVFLWGGGG
jgi:predicted ribosome quality control (RQC) complex YloA/Tae2 family protein